MCIYVQCIKPACQGKNTLDGYHLMIFINTYSIFLIRATAIVTNFCSEKSGSCSPDCFQALAVLKEAAIVDLPSQAVNCSCDGMTSSCGYHQPTQWLSTDAEHRTHKERKVLGVSRPKGVDSEDCKIARRWKQMTRATPKKSPRHHAFPLWARPYNIPFWAHKAWPRKKFRKKQG